MNILAIDDEKLALDMLTESIQAVCRQDTVYSFSSPAKLLLFAQENACEIAFLDIKMRGMTGIELAKKLKDILPHINIIFVTGYDDYAGDAMKLHASGYIFKPVTPEKIKEELEDLRYPVVAAQKEALLKVKCFGKFEVFTREGELFHFDRSKAKELFAYLIANNGSSCTAKEIGATIFEDSPYDAKQKGYIQKIISSMMRSLKEHGVEDVVNKAFNSIAINKSLVDCDYYRFLEGDVGAINSYGGEFMMQYSWPEFIAGALGKEYY